MQGCTRDRNELYVVADIGLHHRGEFQRALGWVNAAARAGVNAVRFPVYRAERAVGRQHEFEYGWLKRCELRASQLRNLADLAHELGVDFWIGVQDVDAAQALLPGCDGWSIGSLAEDSLDADGLALLQWAERLGKPCLACWPVSLPEGPSHVFSQAYQAALARGCPLTVSPSPTLPWCGRQQMPSSLNPETVVTELLALQSHWAGPVAWTGVGSTMQDCVLAVAAGAQLICKTLTLESWQEARESGMTEADLAGLLARLREIHAWRVARDQASTIRVRRSESVGSIRYPIAVRDLPAGHQVVASDIAWVTRPEVDEPLAWSAVVGQALQRPLAAGQCLRRVDLESRRAA